MIEREAQEIVRMIEAGWSFDLGANGRELWREVLLPYELELATRAVTALAKDLRQRPSVADVRSMILKIKRDEGEQQAWRLLPAAPIPEPEWVGRWRRARAADDFRIFPEQIPGYLALQEDHPRNLIAYALPSSDTDNAADWIQPGEYAA